MAKAKKGAVVPAPGPAEGEKPLAVALWEVGHFDVKVLHWQAQQAGIRCPNDLAYRLTGFEYRAGEYGPVPHLLFAVLPVESPDDAPDGWDCTSGN